jgi:hypothetical protein
MAPDEITKRVEERVKEELSSIDMEQRFRDSLDECYDFDQIGGPFAGMQASRVLEEIDPIAFRCGVSDMDTEDMEEIDGEYYDADKVKEIREEVETEIEAEEQAAAEEEIVDEEAAAQENEE